MTDTPTLTNNKFHVPLEVPAGYRFVQMNGDVAVFGGEAMADLITRLCPYQPGETVKVKVECPVCSGTSLLTHRTAGVVVCFQCESGTVRRERTVLRCEPVQQGEGWAWEIEVSDEQTSRL